jgi:hypothetical protein
LAGERRGKTAKKENNLALEAEYKLNVEQQNQPLQNRSKQNAKNQFQTYAKQEESDSILVCLRILK